MPDSAPPSASPANSSPASDFVPTERTRVKRSHQRGRYDRETVYAILDSLLVCHVAYVIDGQPYVTPTAFWREGDWIYWHGSSASRMLRTLEAGIPVSIGVDQLDGLVLARSAFHHSVNYRSVLALGVAEKVTDPDEKARALEAFVERITPGRWAELRPMTGREVKATTVLRMRLEEVAAKVRTGGPVDDEEDYDLDVWAGVVPISSSLGAPIPDERLKPGAEAPAYLDRIILE